MRHVVEFFLRVRSARFGLLLFAYGSAAAFALAMAYLLRFDFHVPDHVQDGMDTVFVWVIVAKVTVLIALGQFRDSLSYFSMPDVKRIVGICVITSIGALLVSQLWGVAVAPPRGTVLIDGVLFCAVLCAGRLALRLVRERCMEDRGLVRHDSKRVGIIGSGESGAALARELLAKPWLGLRPVAIFADLNRAASRIHGVPVIGVPERLADPAVSARVDEVIIARPSASAARIREIVSILRQARLEFRTIPSMAELATGTVNVTNLRPVRIEDLLGRDVVAIQPENIRGMIQGKAVMVTGAGGSIGSELCRQIASFGPCILLLVERSEAALFPIEQELVERGYGGIIVPLVADIMDRPRMEGIFSQFRPHAVFHAAAHKHVPMMEHQPAEAIRNNVLGTVQVGELARRFNCERFLLISTDKAINPTSVMGATKRVAETFIQSMQRRSGVPTKFMAVRFGNVLGSSGSVVPIFTKQIAAGGPVKVTHPDVTRYFMTISEAVTLVLQSAACAYGGEIFVLDMGKPVKIVDLACQMIELSGLRPYVDISIEFTGLRPGEKLFEELSHCAENVTTTDHPKIMRLVCDLPSREQVREMVQQLVSSLSQKTPYELKMLLKQAVPEYTPQLDGIPEIAGIRDLARL